MPASLAGTLLPVCRRNHPTMRASTSRDGVLAKGSDQYPPFELNLELAGTALADHRGLRPAGSPANGLRGVATQPPGAERRTRAGIAARGGHPQQSGHTGCSFRLESEHGDWLPVPVATQRELNPWFAASETRRDVPRRPEAAREARLAPSRGPLRMPLLRLLAQGEWCLDQHLRLGSPDRGDFVRASAR